MALPQCRIGVSITSSSGQGFVRCATKPNEEVTFFVSESSKAEEAISTGAGSIRVSNLEHRSASIGGKLRLSPMLTLNTGYYRYMAQQLAAGERRDNAWTVSTKIARVRVRF